MNACRMEHNWISSKSHWLKSNAYVQRWLKYIIILNKNNLSVCFKASRAAVTSKSMVAVYKEEKHNTWFITPDGTSRLEDWHVRVITGDNTAYKPQKLNLKAEKPQTGTEAATPCLQQRRWVSKPVFVRNRATWLHWNCKMRQSLSLHPDIFLAELATLVLACTTDPHP